MHQFGEPIPNRPSPGENKTRIAEIRELLNQLTDELATLLREERGQ